MRNHMMSYKASMSLFNRSVLTDQGLKSALPGIETLVDHISHLDYDNVDEKRHRSRDYISEPVKYDAHIVRYCLSNLPEPSEWDMETFLELAERFQRMYEKDGKRIFLELSKLLARLALMRLIRPSDDSIPIPLCEYVFYSLREGFRFTRYIKKLRAYSTIISVMLTGFKGTMESFIETISLYPELAGRINQQPSFSYDDWLHEQYLIFWEETEHEDFEWAFKPVEDVDSYFIEEFRKSVRELITKYGPFTLKEPADVEKTFWLTDSSSFIGDKTHTGTQVKLARELIAEGKYNEYLDQKSNNVFKRTLIPVGPANYRDAWCPDLRTLFKIKRNSFLLRQIVGNLPGSCMTDELTASQRRSFLKGKGKTYLWLDLKKSGLTITHELLAIVGEELQSHYGNDFSYLTDFSESIVYDLEGQACHPLRGCGLGNCNEVFTFIQCAIFNFLKKNLIDLEMAAYNDDTIWLLSPTSYVKDSVLIISFFESLGLIVNYAKSTISKSSCFTEEYYISADDEHLLDYRKIQLSILPFAGCLYHMRIWTAKQHFNSVAEQLKGTGLLDFRDIWKRKLIHSYGFEWGYFETLLPYKYGGWCSLSRTNFSEAVEFAIDMKQYLHRVNDLGYTDFIRRWIRFQIIHHTSEHSLFSHRSKIAYKKKMENPHAKTDCFHHSEGSTREAVFSYFSLPTMAQLKENNESHINYYGLRNAKRKIAVGLVDKESKRRWKLYKKFRQEYDMSCLNYGLRKCEMDAHYLTRFLKGTEESPSYYAYPRCLINTSLGMEFTVISSKTLIHYNKEAMEKPTLSDIYTLDCTVESIDTKNWIYGSDPFIISQMHKRLKSGYLLSEGGIRRGNKGWSAAVPPYFEEYCPNQKLFSIEMTTRSGCIPLTYHANPRTDRMYGNRSIASYKDAFVEIIKPSQKRRWCDLKTFHRDGCDCLKLFVGILNSANLSNSEEVDHFLSYAEDLAERNHSETIPGVLEDVEMSEEFDISSRLFKHSVYERLIESEMNQDDLIDYDEAFHPEVFQEYDQDFSNFPEGTTQEEEDEEEGDEPTSRNAARVTKSFFPDFSTYTGWG